MYSSLAFVHFQLFLVSYQKILNSVSSLLRLPLRQPRHHEGPREVQLKHVNLEGVPEERDGVALPGLDALEAPAAADEAVDVFGVVCEGEEDWDEAGEGDAVDEDGHGAGVGLLAGGEAEVGEEDGGQPYPFPEDWLWNVEFL